MALVSFDGQNRLITVNSGTTSLDVKIDLYSDWKEWAAIGNNLKYFPAFRSLGGDNLGSGLTAGSYFFLQNQSGSNWKIRPQEAHHELTILGNLYAENPSLPLFTSTLGNYTVAIKLERSSLTQGVSTTAQMASAVWDYATSSLTTPYSIGKVMTQISGSIDFLEKMEGGKWKITNNQMIFYKPDNSTEVARFDLYDSSGNPTTNSPFERRRA